MMDNKQLSQILARTVYAISSGEYGTNLGSGVSVNINGDLLTAAHVVSERAKKSRRHIKKIRVRNERTQISSTEYEIIIPGLDVYLPHFDTPILLDIAYIRPKNPASSHLPFLNLFGAEIEVGTEVLMAGFPEDAILPFRFIELLDKNDPAVKEKMDELLESNRQLMIKSGIVGYASSFAFETNGSSINGQIFAIDNYMTKGASGGPVVNSFGEIIGLIFEGSEIISTIEGDIGIDLHVPSGITYAISTKTIMSIKAVFNL